MAQLPSRWWAHSSNTTFQTLPILNLLGHNDLPLCSYSDITLNLGYSLDLSPGFFLASALTPQHHMDLGLPPGVSTPFSSPVILDTLTKAPQFSPHHLLTCPEKAFNPGSPFMATTFAGENHVT